jgi:hypothetical protein
MISTVQHNRRMSDDRETMPPPADSESVAVQVAKLGSLSAFAALELALRGDVQ